MSGGEKKVVEPLPPSKAATYLEHICEFDVRNEATFTRLSGIICTIGPASQDPAVLEKLFAAGMNIARLNFSHGSYDYHAETIKNVRTTVETYSKKLGYSFSLAIALDTKGPEIRTGLIEGSGTGEIELKKGDKFKLNTDKSLEEKGNLEMVYVDYANITQVLEPGSHIYMDDGLISLLVESIEGTTVSCTVENGGKLGSRKGINLPGTPVDLPAVSEKDKSDIEFAVEQGLDIIFASFIRDAPAVEEIRKIMGERGKNIKVISKLENQQGLDNVDAIIDAVDGVMVARGDMGIEIPTEKVFVAQKTIISRCNRIGKPVICATQMLESMTYKPRPTRAEGSDVANAILDGADCVMLSGESAKGDYPVECVMTMANICREAEAVIWTKETFRVLAETAIPPVPCDVAAAISAVHAAYKASATAILCLTNTGNSAYLLSRFRPRCPIMAITPNEQVARQMHLYRGVMPILYKADTLPDWSQDIDARISFGIVDTRARGFVKAGDVAIIVTGWKSGNGFNNAIRFYKVPCSAL